MAGDVSIQISDDGFQATVAVIQSRTSIEDVVSTLQEEGVVHGIRSSGINAAIEEAKNSGKAQENVVVAEGDRPDYTTPPSLIHSPRGEEGDLPSLKSLRSLMVLETPEEIEGAAPEVKALFVKSGDLLAVKSDAEIKPGKNVKGEVVEKLVGEEEKYPHFEPGPGVKLQQGKEYRAEITGYAGLLDGKVSVLPPVRMPEDKMEAMYLNVKLLPGSLQPSVQEIVDAFAAVDVTEGVDQERVKAISDALAKGGFKRALVVVATGTPTKPPVDAEAEFSFEHQARAGAERQDGSIDLRERQTFPSVAEDDLLLEARPPAPGTPGMTVTDEEVPVREPNTVELVAGDNVRSAQEGEVHQLFSGIDGGASVNESAVESDSGTHTTYTVSVRSLAQVPGDVDYSTGNIDFKGNVEIKGRVVSGFKVKATGDIIISEGVEDAVEITGDGSLSVRQGIVGSKTKVNVKGGVEAKFIQDALVEAEGDVEVDAYVRTAEIQTHGSVIVKGKGAAGGILGGETWALKSIDTKRAGSERSTTTVLSVGVLPSLFEDFAKKREEAEKANTTREAILKAMGIQALKPDDIKQAIIRNPHKKDKILEWIQKANEVGAQQKQLIGEMKELTAKLKESAAKAYADVQDTAFSRVKVRVGNQERVLDEDLRAVRFHLDKTGEVAGVVDTNLSDVGKLEQEDEGEQEEKSE